MERTVLIEGMTCPHCEANVENALKSVGYKAKADATNKTAVVTSKKPIDDTLVKSAIENAGYKVIEII